MFVENCVLLVRNEHSLETSFPATHDLLLSRRKVRDSANLLMLFLWVSVSPSTVIDTNDSIWR